MSYSPKWTPVKNDSFSCPKCQTKGQIEYREWESSCGGYEDLKYHCKSCDHMWWVEGSDS